MLTHLKNVFFSSLCLLGVRPQGDFDLYGLGAKWMANVLHYKDQQYTHHVLVLFSYARELYEKTKLQIKINK